MGPPVVLGPVMAPPPTPSSEHIKVEEATAEDTTQGATAKAGGSVPFKDPVEFLRTKLEQEQKTAAELKEKIQADEALLSARDAALVEARQKAKEAFEEMEVQMTAELTAAKDKAKELHDKLAAKECEQIDKSVVSLEEVNRLQVEAENATKRAEASAALAAVESAKREAAQKEAMDNIQKMQEQLAREADERGLSMKSSHSGLQETKRR